jgi:hypothetical protein
MNMNTSTQLDELKSVIEELKQIMHEKVSEDGIAVRRRTETGGEFSTHMSGVASQRLKELEFSKGMTGLTTFNTDEVRDFSARIEAVVSSGSTIAIDQEILRSLQFESMRIRQSNISNAHSKTFDWIFRSSPAHPNHVQNHFLRWLHSCNGIFWVSGKPGSGKSTLMKYLCDHERTKAALQSWSGTQTLIAASFFFWNAGTEMQKSQQGLLQSLLYEVLRQCPSLIAMAVPARWNDVHSQQSPLYHSEAWTREELMGAFERLIHLKFTSAKFCFFVDGLDEYEGDHREIVAILNKFATSADIKVCLSSRPWNVFEEAYGQKTTRLLKLQDFTRNDISFFVRNKLAENKHFTLLAKKDNRYLDLVEEIVQKAAGVFLWVILVVRSFKEGITNADTISFLTKRLRELPSDLESFFEHILGQVDRVYWEVTAQAFKWPWQLWGSYPCGLTLFSTWRIRASR